MSFGGSAPQPPSSPSPEDPGTSVEAVADLARGAGLRRVAILAWRDIDDAEAGGSELHAHEVASRWAAAGIDVVLRTSAVAGQGHGGGEGRLPGRPPLGPLCRVRQRADGAGLGPIRPARRAGRDLERDAVSEPGVVAGADGGVPPSRARGDVDDGAALPWRRPAIFSNHGWRPPFYRRSRIVTLSESSRREIVELPVGSREPGQRRAPRSRTVLLAGRPALGPSAGGRRRSPRSRQEFRQADRDPGTGARQRIPDLEAVIVGEGSERSTLEARRNELGAESYVTLPGRVGLRRARRAVPPGVGGRVDVDPGGLGNDDQRGGRLPDPGHRHADPGTSSTRSITASRACWSTRRWGIRTAARTRARRRDAAAAPRVGGRETCRPAHLGSDGTWEPGRPGRRVPRRRRRR